MPVTQIGAATQAGTSGVGITPTGAASGDMLLFCIGCYDQNAVTITPPVGANLILRVNHPNTDGDSLLGATYWMPLSGTPAATYTFTQSGGSGNAIDVITTCWRGADAVNPIGTGAAATTSNNGISNPAATVPGLTPPVAGAALVWFMYGDDSAITVAPDQLQWSPQIPGTGAGNNLSGGYNMLYRASVTLTSPTGTITVQTNNNVARDYVTQLICIVPAVTTPSTPTAGAATAGEFDPTIVISPWFENTLYGTAAWFDPDLITNTPGLAGTAAASSTSTGTLTGAGALAGTIVDSFDVDGHPDRDWRARWDNCSTRRRPPAHSPGQALLQGRSAIHRRPPAR